MAPGETSAEIDDDAARWAARSDGAALSADESAALQSWLAGDPRRLGAYVKAKAVLARLEKGQALGEGFDPARFRSSRGVRRPHRRALMTGAAAAGVVGAIAGAGAWVAEGRRLQFETRKGDIRLTPLADGSSATLNTDSRLDVRFSWRERRVHLARGEALFDVAKDPGRPFIVAAGRTRVRAVGTSFAVRLLDDAVEVLVREGVVEVHQDGAAGRPLRLEANQKAVAAAGTLTAAELPVEALSRALAWREGMVAFEVTTLAAAAAEFARYSDRRILIDDPLVGRMTITGRFSTTNPDGFARAAAASLDLKAVQTSTGVLLAR